MIIQVNELGNCQGHLPGEPKIKNLGYDQELSWDPSEVQTGNQSGILTWGTLEHLLGINLRSIQGINQGSYWGSNRETYTGQRNSPPGCLGPGWGQYYLRGRGRRRCHRGDPCPAGRLRAEKPTQYSPPPLGATIQMCRVIFSCLSMSVAICQTRRM